MKTISEDIKEKITIVDKETAVLVKETEIEEIEEIEGPGQEIKEEKTSAREIREIDLNQEIPL